MREEEYNNNDNNEKRESPGEKRRHRDGNEEFNIDIRFFEGSDYSHNINN